MVKAKVIKKQWCPILAPKIFGSSVLGETLVYDPEKMIGKNIIKNLMEITSDVKRQNVNIKFHVGEVRDGKAFTSVIGYYIVQSSIKRLIRRNIEKITMSFSCKTLGDKTLRIKPILITRASTTGSVLTKIRKNAQEFLVKYIGAISYDNLISDLVNHKLQNSLKKTLSKIYPLRICEIKSMEIVDSGEEDQVRSKEKTGKKEEPKPAKKAKESKEEKEGEKSEEIEEAKKEEKSDEIKDTEKKEEKPEEKS